MTAGERRPCVALGTDHGGWPLKEVVADEVGRMGWHVLDCGANRLDPEDDYPDFAARVAKAVTSGRAERGILLCGSGVGVVLAANRFAGVRACLCHDPFTAAQGVRDDDMNVLCLGGRVIGPELARVLVAAFLAARYAADVPRYARRVEKIRKLERRP